MSIITKITTQKKTTNRYNIFLDEGQGEQYAFSVDEAVLIHFQLKKGMEIDPSTKTQILFFDHIQKAYQQAIYYLSFRIRSEQEVRTFLKKKEIEEAVIQEVILKLYNQKYLDDGEFALAYVRTQINTTDKGPNVIKRELKDRGIHDTYINHALELFTLDTQIEKLTKLIPKIVQKNKHQSERQTALKVEMMLKRKGYNTKCIQHTMNEIKVEKSEDAEWEALYKQGMKTHKRYSQKFEGIEYEQKMKQSLYQKGFSIDLINRLMNEIKEQQLD